MNFRKGKDTMGHKLIFFTGVYDTLDFITEEFADAFERMGYEILQIDTRDMGKGLVALASFVRSPVTAAITFNNLAFHLEVVQGKNIWEELHIPCINILVDHPNLYPKALESVPSNAVVICIDRKHMDYLQRFYPNIPAIGFLPHGGKVSEQALMPINEREIDVLYAGGLSKKYVSEVMPDFSQFAFDAKAVADQAYERMITDTDLTIEEAVEQALLQKGVFFTDTQLADFISKIHYIEMLAVSYYREKLIRTMLSHGVRVHLYGQGWDICDFVNHPNLIWKGVISPREVVVKMQQSKVVLNTTTWFKDGAHDRIFNGMLAGAVAVTDNSVYLEEQFQGYGSVDENRAELLLFSLNEMDRLAVTVVDLLKHPDKMQQIADNGRKKAELWHTWECRAKELHEELLVNL